MFTKNVLPKCPSQIVQHMLLAAYNFGACVSAMNVRSLVSTMRRVGEQKGVGLYLCNCATCKSAKRACFYSYSAVCRHHNMYGTSTAEGQ